MRLIALMLPLLLVFGGCAGLPTSGSPAEFPIEVPDREPLGQAGSGPQPGTSPEQLIADFLRASAAGSFDDYATAKRYLLPKMADTWKPTAQVMVYPTDQLPVTTEHIEAGSTTQVSVDVPTMATLDGAGFLHELPSIEHVPVVFRLAHDSEGEWRIAALQDGLVLSQSSFTTGFGQFNLYFSSADEQTLVADPRWVPRLRVSSHLTQALIDGPPEQLSGAVTPNLAAGLTLPTGGVEVRDRRAHVDLEGQMPPDPDLRVLLQWQIATTLRQAPNVQEVQVSINGLQLDPKKEPAGLDYSLDRLIGVASEGLVLGPPGSMEPVGLPPSESPDITFPAVGPLAASPLAWVAGGGGEVDVLQLGDEEPRTVSVPGASKLSVDRFGNIWTSGGEGKRDLIFIAPGAEPTIVETGLPDAKIERAAVAADGARIALLVGEPGGGKVWVGTVVHDPQGIATIRMVALQERLGADVKDISWSDPGTLLALSDSTSTTVKVAPVGGFLQQHVSPSEARWVSGGTGLVGVIVQRADQVAFQRVGAAWRDLGAEVSYIASPG